MAGLLFFAALFWVTARFCLSVIVSQLVGDQPSHFIFVENRIQLTGLPDGREAMKRQGLEVQNRNTFCS